MSHLAAYLRVSSQKQEDDGYGLPAQRADIEAWAAREGHTIDAWFQEVVSGAAPLTERRVLLDACRAAWRCGGLVVARVDRWTREPEETAMLQHMFGRNGSTLWFANGPNGADKSPTGQLMRGILELFAAYDRLSINLRLATGRTQARANGVVTGPAPFGYRVREDWKQGECNLEVDVAEAQAVRFILGCAANGKSAHWIAGEAATRGYVGRGGGKLQKSLVLKVIARRPFYEGKVNLSGGSEVRHPPLMRHQTEAA